MTPRVRVLRLRSRVFAAAVAALLIAQPAAAQLLNRGAAAAPPSQQAGIPRSMDEIRLSFAPVVKMVAPAVVNVYAQRIIRSRTSMLDDPFFGRFFGQDLFGMPRERVQQSLGSGVIVRADGVIVTNNHVVADTDELTVVLADRREFSAEVVLADERTDLAILRIDPGGESLPTIPFADSDTAEVGDLVLALGNPFGVGQTVTSGIISAVARTQVGIADYRFFLQTDAAINPGNSGGALVNSAGALVGINTAIFSRTGGSIGIGFAIPSNMVSLVVEGALSGGTLQRPWFGAGTQPVTADLAESLGLGRRATGVLVTEIYPDGPASKAGLKSGDVVTAIGDFAVEDPQSLRYRLATQRIGESVKLTYVRDGHERAATLTAAVPPSNPRPDETQLSGINPFSGAQVVNLSPAFNDEHGLDPVQQGVAVLTVARRSYAAQFVRPGDIITQVNGIRIRTVNDLRAVLEDQTGTWEITVIRGGRVLTGTVRL